MHGPIHNKFLITPFEKSRKFNLTIMRLLVVYLLLHLRVSKEINYLQKWNEALQTER